MIPYGKQSISKSDIDSVVEVLQSDFITQGPVVPKFEKKLAEAVSAKHCVAVTNATSALHIGLLALGVGPGDSVWTSPVTFVATSNAALYCGASVKFIDICPKTINMDIGLLAKKLELAEQEGNLPKVVIAVHLSGRSCDMLALNGLRKKYGFKVLEDASHAIGASYDGQPVGSCLYSDLCVFSFHPVKIITTGEGGAITSNDASLASKLAALRSHGVSRDPEKMVKNDGPWYYEQHSLGFNYRMTEMQAALGHSQLDRLSEFIARRQFLANRYDELLKDILDTTQSQSGWHLYIVRLGNNKTPLERRHLFESLRSDGIGVNVHYIPVYRQPYYQNMGYKIADFPNAERYYESAISIPLFYGMTESEQDKVVKCLLMPRGYQTIF